MTTRIRRTAAPSAAELHRAWLELVDTEGPFLSVPTLSRVWQQGMPPVSLDCKAVLAEATPAFQKAWEHWDTHRDDHAALELYRTERDTWVDTVLREVIGWNATYITDLSGPDFVEILPARSPDRSVTVSAHGVLAHRGVLGALVLVVDPIDSLRATPDDGWAATPIDRLTRLLQESGISIGVVTDGRWWGLVCARPNASVASGIVDAHTWIEEPSTRNAFFAVLDRRRLIAGQPDTRLPKLFEESVKSAEEITEALGTQVRHAVELLVQAMSESALAASLDNRPDALPTNRAMVYDAAVTVMMRLVFLLFAEERGLLPTSELFAESYGMSEQFDILKDRSRNENVEALDTTYLTWHRLLATSHALYHGASFEDMRIPPYGGSLFDGDRYLFLAARDERGLLITVSDRVMLAVLQAVQVAVVKGIPSRISFREIDVEQIGYIYEGLLGYSSTGVDEVTVGLLGKDGAEPEIPLATIETLATANPTSPTLATAIITWVKAHQPAAACPTPSKLANALDAEVADVDHALRSVTTAPALQERLRPFIGIIRRDLRGRPFVVHPGGVLVVETASRASAGAHYTPKSLAEEVVRHALEPLVYSPGPHQTVDQAQWTPISSDEILDLKIADIACGSGAFLVAAARYLADRLVEAWHREGTDLGNPNTLHTKAIRHIVAKCLYGADINELAVEMCKLSLWLVSLDPKLPFSFVDDKIFHGNSLLGLTRIEQLQHQRIFPDDEQLNFSESDIEATLHKVATLRENLASEIDESDPQRSATAKRRQLERTQRLTAELATIADGVVAAGLAVGGKPGRALTEAYLELGIAVGQAFPPDGSPGDGTRLDRILTVGLTPTVATDYTRWKPLHWILAVPDVAEHGWFDAIVGNPPFLGGQKLTGAMGTNVRDWFVHALAGGRRGSADLVAYFLLRAESLLGRKGNLGLIATNSVAQGDTREVGLDTLVADGITITRAIQSRAWPSASANLEFAAVWGTKDRVADTVPRDADGTACQRISTLLEPAGRVDGVPSRLKENRGIAFQGCIVLGMGFVLDFDEAAEWIEADSKNVEVLFPYLGGEDLNSRPDTSATRWVIDFNHRCETCARRYPLPYARVEQKVKPQRATNKRAVRRQRWWQFAELAKGMRAAVTDLDEVIAITLVSKTVMPMRVSARQVPSHKLAVFATDRFDDLAVLSSSVHLIWVVKYSSTMRTDINYSPSDVFETFPRPTPTARLAEIGRTLDRERREIMLRRDLGLTKLYNLVNDPETPDSDLDVARLREIHVELDEAVMAAYDWGNIALDHGFHTYRQMRRWTVSPTARVEILDRLLEENQRRAAL
ncbi:DNA methyltransferase [Nocardia abscessus]|uniref:DNA methyltransferase n=1 Tax=Nocardia abscessus TaxID=120957 RepID=UPI002454B4D5|nr:DNA methyltransferase [Nocardia abscessus]